MTHYQLYKLITELVHKRPELFQHLKKHRALEKYKVNTINHIEQIVTERNIVIKDMQPFKDAFLKANISRLLFCLSFPINLSNEGEQYWAKIYADWIRTYSHSCKLNNRKSCQNQQMTPNSRRIRS